jgi:hypothetical protein
MAQNAGSGTTGRAKVRDGYTAMWIARACLKRKRRDYPGRPARRLVSCWTKQKSLQGERVHSSPAIGPFA